MVQQCLYLLGARKVDSSTLRFVFMMPTSTEPDVMDGDGVILELVNCQDIVVGRNTPTKASLLEAYVETLVEGGEEVPARGPIKCGIGIAGDQVMIVEHGNAEPIVAVQCGIVRYMSHIKIDDLPTAE